MTDTITLIGTVATEPRSMHTGSGLSIASFRLASSQRRYDRTRGAWIEADTNWYTVTAFRHLADHAIDSLSKGDRVVVVGRLRIRSWENGERSGTSVEVDAEAVAADLLWGTTRFTRSASKPHGQGEQHDAGSPEREGSASGDDPGPAAIAGQPAPASSAGSDAAPSSGAASASPDPAEVAADQWHRAADLPVEVPF